jgi:hypothetical protein
MIGRRKLGKGVEVTCAPVKYGLRVLLLMLACGMLYDEAPVLSADDVWSLRESGTPTPAYRALFDRWAVLLAEDRVRRFRTEPHIESVWGQVVREVGSRSHGALRKYPSGTKQWLLDRLFAAERQAWRDERCL